MSRRSRLPPRLPLSAFSPSHSPSPATLAGFIDSHLRVPANPDSNLLQYRKELVDKLKGAVLTVDSQPSDIATLLSGLQSRIDRSIHPLLCVSVPFSLDESQPPPYPSRTETDPPVTLSTSYPPHSSATDVAIKNLKMAMDRSNVVDIEVQSDVMGSPTLYDSFEDLLTKATLPTDEDAAVNRRTKIVLSNLFPTPTDLNQLATNTMPCYQLYQSRVSPLSLFLDLYIKLTPPFMKTPPVLLQEYKPWLKLCLTPIIEAFGFDRIMFGSSPSQAGGIFDTQDTWHDLVRESLTELGVEQNDIDKVFKENAIHVYSNL